MISRETIRNFLSSDETRNAIGLTVQATLMSLGSLVLVVFFKQSVLTGSTIGYWALGIATAGVIGFLAMQCSTHDLIFFSSDQSGHSATRVGLFSLIAIGWAVLLGIGIHWSFAPAFLVVTVIATAALGRVPISSAEAKETESKPEVQQNQDLTSRRSEPVSPPVEPKVEHDESSELNSHFASPVLSSAEQDEECEWSDEDLPSEVVRQIVYSKTNDEVFVTAYIRHQLEANEASGVIQVPLYPHLNFDPDLQIMQIEGPAVTTRVTQASRFGVRVELKADQPSSEKSQLLFELILSQKQQGSLAKAG